MALQLQFVFESVTILLAKTNEILKCVRLKVEKTLLR